MKEISSKIKKYVYYLLITLFSLLLMISVGMLALNYSGYCFKQGRYISRDEIIYAAVERLLEVHYSPYVRRYKVVNGKTILVQPKEKHRIYYQSVEEFLELNPNCCELERFSKQSRWQNYLKKTLKGRYLTKVKIKYKVRYLDDNGEIKSYVHPEPYYKTVRNCGEVWQ
jgi:hypothetical protein